MGRKETLIYYGRECKSVEQLWKSVSRYPASPTLRHNCHTVKLSHTWAYPTCNQHTQTYLHIHVDCGGIHNCQVLESTLVSTNRWKDKENKLNIHGRVLFGYKEQNYIICRKIELKTIMLHKISHMT